MSYAYDVYAQDIDSDGDMDVVGSAYNSDQVVWFENNGSEIFTAIQLQQLLMEHLLFMLKMWIVMAIWIFCLLP